MAQSWLGIDFGTSNTAAAVLEDGAPKLIPLSDQDPTLPTTFFFEFDTRETLIGGPANQALLNGAEGRFMRALKRILGTPLMHEPRQILNDRITFVEIIGRFLSEVKTRAEAATGCEYTAVLSGKPVVFHGTGDPREDQALDDLRLCYQAAGFEDVAFMAEPEAAAVASGALQDTGQVGLIVDIGGGTSDFSVFETTPDGVRILANHGVRIGGTDFDRAVSIANVMPLLGAGTLLRDAFGPGTAAAPRAIFNDLATWEKIPFQYTSKTRRLAADMERQALEPAKLHRLSETLEHELGHDIAFAVEDGKISANGDDARAQINLNVIEPGLRARLTASSLTEVLKPFCKQLDAGAHETLTQAGCSPDQITKVVYVGGSSLMRLVPDTMKALFPQAEHSFSNVFTAVADGLALATAQRA